MTQLYLIRHAEAEGLSNDFVNFTSPNPGISVVGVRQAELLRERLQRTREIRADVLISSPLRRARETAEIIAPALGLPVVIDDELQAFSFGEGEAMPMEVAEIADFNGNTPRAVIAPYRGKRW